MAVIKKGSSWFVQYYDIHKKKRQVKAGSTKAIAQELERKLLATRDMQKRFGYLEIEQITIEALIEKYQEYSQAHKRSSTAVTENFHLKTFSEYFKSKYASDLTNNDLEEYKIYRAKLVKNVSINRELAVIRNMFKKAFEWNYVKTAITTKLFKTPPGRLRYLSPEEAKKLISGCKEDLKNVIQFAILTGMRKGEILGLKWKDIDLKNSIIHINDSKTNERRDVFISRALSEVIARLDKIDEHLFIFRDLHRRFQRALIRVGIEDFTFHDLRHTAASWLAIEGVPLITIKELLGHKDIKMTMRYAHLSPDARKQATDTLSSMLKSL